MEVSMEDDSVSPATVFCIRLVQPRSSLLHKMSLPELCRNFSAVAWCGKLNAIACASETCARIPRGLVKKNSGFSSYIQSPENLLRVLVASSRCSVVSSRNESLARHLLLVQSIQLDIQNIFLEELPEYFDVQASLPFEEDLARLIINQFRWLDFIVNPDAFTEKLMGVLSICPLDLKKEIIGSLPEIIGDQNNKTVVESLEQMLRDDSSVIVPVLDSFSNLNLDEQLQEQVMPSLHPGEPFQVRQ